MKYRFRAFELDAGRRELLRAGEPVDVQPLVLELLLYLVCNRDRVVSKDELLTKLWAGSHVSEASLSRAISLARRAIDDSSRSDPLIRTHMRVGFRFCGDVHDVASEPHPSSTLDRSLPMKSSYARDGRTHIAYQVLGSGPVDLVVVHGWTLSMQSVWEEPDAAAFHRRLASKSRLILFDKRGTGLSDRVKDLPGLAQRMEDLTAVLDAVGSTRAFVLGISEGASMAILYAASHPERVCGLGLIGGFARMRCDADQPFGWTQEQVDRLKTYIRTHWGEGASLHAAMASQRERPAAREWAKRVEQIGASPGAALELWSMNEGIDVRDVLPVVQTPTLVVHIADDPVIDVAHGRWLARAMPHARYVELAGIDHVPFHAPVAEPTIAALEEWLAGDPDDSIRERILATVLATDFDPKASADDTAWVHQLVVAHRGRPASAVGGSLRMLFDAPHLGVRCAVALRDGSLRRGRALRFALHCSEVERRAAPSSADTHALRPDVGVDGAAVALSGSILEHVTPGEVWISRTLRDLVVGSGLVTESRGDVPLAVDEAPWGVFAAGLAPVAAEVA